LLFGFNFQISELFQSYELPVKKTDSLFVDKKRGKLTASHRSTIYPCFIPDLGKFTGAGRTGLTLAGENSY